MTIAGNDEGNLTKSFQGLRVLDFSTTIAGPHCSRMLADMGAEVIKVESAEGETMRTRPPMRDGCSSVFGGLNAGKKSLVLDLKSPEAIGIIRRLLENTDILVENFRPGVMRRLKLDYGALRELHPRLIYCSISGYGQTGPSAELPAYAPVIHAASGYDMAHLSYQPGRARPDYCGIYHADVLAGVYAFGAIAAALYQRQATQQGQHIDVSMLESMLSLTLNEVQWSQFAVTSPSRPMFGPVETADGYVMIAIASEKTFQNLVKAAGHPEWIGDPRFAKYNDRRSNWASLMDGIETWSRTLSTEQCLAELNKNGVPSSAYRSVAEALADPQLAHRGALAEVEDDGGTFKVMNLPFRMSGAEVSAGRRAATLGEHTVAYLRESGLSEDQIAAFTGKPAGRAADERRGAATHLSRPDRHGNVGSRATTIDGREAMKSFQVTDFNAPLQEVDAPTPRPSGTQVLLKVKAAGVCHSDLHIWEGGYDLGHGRKPLSLKDRGVSLPRTMGHETVGEVLAFGPDVKDADKGDLKVGDVALVYPWLGCGKCELCLADDENMCMVKPNALGVYCDGGYADHMTVPHPKYLINLKGLDPVTAAPYACSGVTTYSALKKVESAFNTPIVIFGAGGLGLMALSLLKAMGGKGAIVVDIDARKREAAEKAGALATVDGAAPDALEQLAQKAGGPIRAVIDLVGNAKTTQLGFDCLTKGGKLVIVGLFGGGAPWALPLIPIKAITIQGSYVGNLRETQELLDLVRAKKIGPIPVTPMPLARANDALVDLQKGRLVGRAVLTP